MNLINYLPKMAKSLLAGLIAGTGALAVAAADNGITTGEWIGALSTGLTALGVVWGVRNGE